MPQASPAYGFRWGPGNSPSSCFIGSTFPSRGLCDVSPVLTSQPVCGSHLRHPLCSPSLAVTWSHGYCLQGCPQLSLLISGPGVLSPRVSQAAVWVLQARHKWNKKVPSLLLHHLLPSLGRATWTQSLMRTPMEGIPSSFHSSPFLLAYRPWCKELRGSVVLHG